MLATSADLSDPGEVVRLADKLTSNSTVLLPTRLVEVHTTPPAPIST